MSKDASASGRKQRDTDDQARDRAVYRYLLNLTDLGELSPGETPNESSIAKQWGVEDNRIFVRRVLRSVLYEELYAANEKEKRSSMPALTLSKLVNILSALQAYQREHRSLDRKSKKASAILTRLEKRKALQMFAQLSPDERLRLGLESPQEKALLDQILEKATDKADSYTAADVTRLYRYFLQQLSDRSLKALAHDPEEASNQSDASELDQYIKKIVTNYTKQYSQGLSAGDKQDRDNVFASKISREVERIEIQSGVEPGRTFLSQYQQTAGKLHSAKHLAPEFIQRLAHSVIDNELLTDEFPIHIKHFEIERVKPLPLYIRDENDTRGLLNKAFVPDGPATSSVKGLGSQVAYRVRVHFYIKTPPNFTPKFDDITIFKETAGQKRLEFSEEVVGVGCITAHVIAVINRVLFWDIPSLKEYLPIAEGIHRNDEVIGGRSNSPVWSHCVARLYKRADIREAIVSERSCAEAATTAEVASADFCGFDLLETVSKAALFARLQLIKQTLANRPDITAKQYIQDLCIRVEEINALKRAQSLLSAYPFSLRAMEGQLEATIFKDNKYRKRLPGPIFKQSSQPTWSAVAIEAHLSIAEANLKEGLLHIAKRYLDALPASFNHPEEPVSELLMARYWLCQFRYYYLSDLEDPACPVTDRYVAVRKAEEALEKAEDYLQQRLQHYDKLDELTQSNLHPQFYFLSRVYAHRAKLHIFFPDYMLKKDKWQSLLEPIRLLENARIYAARDGAPALYAQWSAYQAWCYIMLAYLGKTDASRLISKSSQPSSEGKRIEDFSYQSCLAWAEGLVEHAEICYSPTGKHCYQQIKDSGGGITDYPGSSKSVSKVAKEAQEIFQNIYKGSGPKYYKDYGSTMVEVIPLIQELFQNKGDKKNQRYYPSRHMIGLELDLLKKPGKDESSSIYLFGMQAGMLLFARGLLMLCQSYQSDEDLIRGIDREAMRLLQYCCAIASDGTERVEDKDEWPTNIAPHSIVLNRTIPTTNPEKDTHSTDRLLQCLYPHRFTHFADLSKIFIIVCRLMLLLSASTVQDFYHSQQSWPDIEPLLSGEIGRIRGLVKELRENNNFPFRIENACGQQRYNGQMEKHYVQLESYIERLFDSLEHKRDLEMSALALRDRLVTDIFRIIQGARDV